MWLVRLHFPQLNFYTCQAVIAPHPRRGMDCQSYVDVSLNPASRGSKLFVVLVKQQLHVVCVWYIDQNNQRVTRHLSPACTTWSCSIGCRKIGKICVVTGLVVLDHCKVIPNREWDMTIQWDVWLTGILSQNANFPTKSGLLQMPVNALCGKYHSTVMMDSLQGAYIPQQVIPNLAFITQYITPSYIHA